MKRSIYFSILLFIFFFALSCTNDQLEYRKEMNVMNDIFRQLTDSLFRYPVYPPPPPPYGYNEKGNLIIDSSNVLKYKKLIAQIDTSVHIISITDSLIINEFSFEERISHLKADSLYTKYYGAFDNYLKLKKEPKAIEINDIKNNTKFKLIKYNESTRKEINDRMAKFKYSYHGSLTLSRIYFNNLSDHCFLVCKYNGLPYFHSSFLVLIEQNRNEWRIEKLKTLSAS